MIAQWPPAGMRMCVVAVRDSHLAYVAGGPADVRSGGPALIFLHGNPTSSFLWRNVLAAMTGNHRCVAVDLIGMGRSGKPDIAYSYQEHVERLDDFLDAISPTSAVIVGHDWGGVLALQLARRRPDIVVGVAVCETHLRPWPAFDDMDAGTRLMFGPLRTPGDRERLILDENVFIESVLPSGMAHTLTEEEWNAYRAPYLRPADRLPILAWVQQIPIGGQPAAVHAAVLENQRMLLAGAIPRLLLYGEPGAVVDASTVEWCADAANQLLTVRPVGAGMHFLPEDRAGEIALELESWLRAAFTS